MVPPIVLIERTSPAHDQASSSLTSSKSFCISGLRASGNRRESVSTRPALPRGARSTDQSPSSLSPPLGMAPAYDRGPRGGSRRASRCRDRLADVVRLRYHEADEPTQPSALAAAPGRKTREDRAHDDDARVS